MDDGFIGGDCAASSENADTANSLGSTSSVPGDTDGTSSADDTTGGMASQDGSDGSTDSGGATDSSSGSSGPQPLCPDNDSDGFANLDECVDVDPDDAPPGHIPPTAQGDCDDDNPNTHPGAAEDKDPAACTNDDDDDGLGDANPPAGVTPGTDCDDDDAAIGECVIWCIDGDSDGFGDPMRCQEGPSNMPPSDDHVPNGDDCNDADGEIFPGAATAEPELCTLDADGDGYGPVVPPSGGDAGSDCDDDSAFTFPGAAELEAAPLSTECLRDEDDDGFGDDSPPPGVTAGTDCIDVSAVIFPGAATLEPALCTVDADGDGWGDWDAPNNNPGADEGSDCDDNSPATERCALLVTRDGSDSAALDGPLRSSLESLGFTVVIRQDFSVNASDADPAVLVVVSETALSFMVNTKFRDVDEGVIVLEALIWDDMDMAPAGSTVDEIDLTIIDDTHPIAAGLSGDVSFMIDDPGSALFFTTVSASAEVVASRVGAPDEVNIFAFPSGVEMEDGLFAPGPRVGFGADVDAGFGANGQLSTDGLLMFEAAVLWAAP